jgi:hypothetical protein
MTARYQRVPREEDGLSTETPRVESPVDPRLRRKQLMKGIDDKIHAVFWVGGAGAVIYFLDFFKVAFTDERVNRWVLRGGWDRIDAPCRGHENQEACARVIISWRCVAGRGGGDDGCCVCAHHPS